MQIVKITNPFTGEVSEQLLNTEEVVSGVDAEGNYLGIVTRGTEFLATTAPPAPDNYKWNFTTSSWEYFEPILDIKARVTLEIDSAAGTARLRYITDVPGQAAVYAAKLEQAQAYITDQTIIGGYLKADAEASNTLILETAQQIVDKANLWNNVTGPQIEAIRRKYKLAVDSAATSQQVFEIRNTAISELAQV